MLPLKISKIPPVNFEQSVRFRYSNRGNPEKQNKIMNHKKLLQPEETYSLIKNRYSPNFARN